MTLKPYEHKVQYYETDQMGVVHHSNYIRWFEEARTYFLEEIGFSYKRMEDEGILSPVLHVDADYRTMTKYGETVQIETSIPFYNGIKFTFSYVIKDKESGEVRCEGESKHCFLTREGKPLSLRKSHPQLHELLERNADL